MSTAIEQIKEKLSIVDVVGSYLTLQKAGLNLKAKCPFHNEKTPSFFVSPERGTYYCFGCGAKGDIISFVQNFEGLDFIGALRILAERAGVELSRDNFGQNKAERSEKEKLYLIMEHATLFFQRALSGVPTAKEYLKKRGLKDETIRTWRLGYAPLEWQALGDHLRSKGFTDRDIELAGLVKMSDKSAGVPAQRTPKMPPNASVGKTAGDKTIEKVTTRAPSHYYDRFRGRIMFPIFDASGRVVAFSGRQFASDGTEAKYINSPETPLFEKSKILYGYDKARLNIRQSGYTLLVEGQMDLIMSHQAGFKNAVATSGTALTRQQLEIMERLSPNLVICYDGDHAGREASKRGWQIAIGLGLEVKIAELPSGKDPADLALENPKELATIIAKARHIILAELAKVVSEFPDARERGKAITKDILPYVAEVRSAIEKSHFVATIALEAGLSEKIVWQELEQVQEKLRQSGHQAINQTGSAQPLSADRPTNRRMSLERSILGILFWQEEKNRQQTADTGEQKTENRKQKTEDGRQTTDNTQQTTGEKGMKKADSQNLKNKLGAVMNARHFEKLERELEARRDQLIFEAEVSFGAEQDLAHRLDELVLDLKEEYIKEEYSQAMRLHQVAESRKELEKAKELLNRCDELIIALKKVAEEKLSFSSNEAQQGKK
jgi:DNA primase